jgi:hypothetical protein
MRAADFLFTYFDNTLSTSLSLRARGEKGLQKQHFIDYSIKRHYSKAMWKIVKINYWHPYLERKMWVLHTSSSVEIFAHFRRLITLRIIYDFTCHIFRPK